MSKLKNTLKYAGALVTLAAVSPLSSFAAFVQPSDANTIDLTGINSVWNNLAGISVNRMLVFLINFILIVAGILCFFFLLFGGVQWIMSGGEKEGTEKARKRITSALIGLAIVFSAYAIAFLVQTVFGINILNFTIPVIVTGP